MVRYVENQPSYLLKKFFEAVTVLGDNLLFSIMTFRLKTLSIRSNIFLASRCLRLSDFVNQVFHHVIIEVFKTFRSQGEGVEDIVNVIGVLSVVNCQTDSSLQSWNLKD